jgi:hypothetical protein
MSRKLRAQQPPPLLTVDQAQAVLRRNVANLVKKSSNGKALTPRELRVIAEFAGEKATVISHDVEWVSSDAKLGEVLGHHRASFPRWRREFSDAPRPRDNGEHNVGQWRKFFQGHPEIKSDAGPVEKAALEIEKLRQQCRRIKFDNDVADKKFLPLDRAVADVADLAESLKASLRTKLEDDLPPLLAGLPAPAIRVQMKKVNDELCRMMEGCPLLKGAG